MKKERKESEEWVKNLRLAKYKSLSLKKDAESQKLMKEIE